MSVEEIATLKVLVYTTFALNTPHFETELEIIQKHLDSGDVVEVAGCSADVACCDVNWAHSLALCAKCVGRRVAGLGLLNKPVKMLRHIQLRDEQINWLAGLEDLPSDVTELKKLRYGNFDVGYGVVSSLASWKRDPDLDSYDYEDMLFKLYKSAIATYMSCINHLESNKYDLVYVYNGRYALMRAVLRACQSMNVECYTHERGSIISRYELWKNTTIHDLKNTAANIDKHWEGSQADAGRVVLAEQFFTDKAAGVSSAWKDFCAGHETGLLPDEWDDAKKNISIFISSEDELVSIGDSWVNTIYSNQLEGVVSIVKSLESASETHLYLRVHPNLAGVDNAQTRGINKLFNDNLTIIPADSKISTYTLLKHSNKVVTFGSTVGIEATYWGIPSILAGQSFYKYLDVTYNPETHEDVVRLMLADLPPKDKALTLRYGYYWQTFGREFSYFVPSGIYSGKFKETSISPPLSYRLFARFLSLGTLWILPGLCRKLLARKVSRWVCARVRLQ